MEVAFTGFRVGLKKEPLVELLMSEARMSAKQAQETVERILAIPVESIEVSTPEKAAKVASSVEGLGVPASSEGRKVNFSGWRLGMGERRFVEVLESLGDVPPTLARATAHRLAEGPMVLVVTPNSVAAGELIDQATPLGAVCRLAEASMWDLE